MDTQPKIKVETDTVNGHQFHMIEVVPAPFMMGSDRYDDEQPIHEVTIKKPYFIGEFPVTQALWKAVMGEDNNPSYFIGDDRPVETVSWDDIKERFLPEIKKKTGIEYRLPSESEWEFAARGGILGLCNGFEFSGSNRLKEVGWYEGNNDIETMPVGMKMPNELGLYDMSGNVFEWCEDVYHDSYSGHPDNGNPWMDGKKEENRRMVRGGSWFYVDFYCRVSYRNWFIRVNRFSVIGFRLVRYLPSAL